MEILNHFVRNDKDIFVFRLQQSAIFFKNIRENPLKYDVINCTTYFIMLHQFLIETSLNKKTLLKNRQDTNKPTRNLIAGSKKITAKLKDQVNKILIFIEQGW